MLEEVLRIWQEVGKVNLSNRSRNWPWSAHCASSQGLTPEQMQHATKRDSLELQRKRIVRELEACRNDRVRKTMEDGLAFLNAQLDGLAKAQGN